jgi:hypothetical protein
MSKNLDLLTCRENRHPGAGNGIKIYNSWKCSYGGPGNFL